MDRIPVNESTTASRQFATDPLFVEWDRIQDTGIKYETHHENIFQERGRERSL